MTVHTTLPSPLGELTLVRAGERLAGVYFARQWYRPAEATFGRRDDGFEQIVGQLGEYFAGGRRTFDLPLHLDGTAEQRALWSLVARIPYGQTRTYGSLGAELGIDARAVGALMGRNPVCIVVPCHRVVGAGGRLTGYAGGLERKRALLELEGAIRPEPEQLTLV
jgi:methylated-DNA-[protein]-cysteine S-methyltransferase